MRAAKDGRAITLAWGGLRSALIFDFSDTKRHEQAAAEVAGLFLFCLFVCMELFLITRPGQNMFGAQKPQNSPSAAEAMLFQDADGEAFISV